MKRRSVRVAGPSVLVDEVARELELGADEAGRVIEQGAVYVQGRRVREQSAKLSAGQVVTIVVEEHGRSALAKSESPAALKILFEDDAVLAVDKPAGVLTQPGPSRVGDSLLDAAGRHLGGTAGLVHRLDRETSGVVLFGKTAAATAGLAEAFRLGTAQKTYLAVTSTIVPEKGTIDWPLSKDPSRVGRWRASRTANGIAAKTDYERVFPSGDEGPFCIVRLFPKTGRTHQLRAHLTALGAPIAGDVLYGGARTVAGIPATRCLLHAWRIELPHPTRRSAALKIEAPVPADMKTFLDAAR